MPVTTSAPVRPRPFLQRFAGWFGLTLPPIASFRTAPADAPINARAFDWTGQFALTSAAVWRCCSIIAAHVKHFQVNLFFV
jgi:hypothetical protein